MPYSITFARLGNFDLGATIRGYIGLLFISGTYFRLGLFASSFSNNRFVGFLLALAIGILFHFVFGFLSMASSGFVSEVLYFLSLGAHFESISRGVVDSKDIIYFISIIFLSFVGTEAILQKNRT